MDGEGHGGPGGGGTGTADPVGAGHAHAGEYPDAETLPLGRLTQAPTRPPPWPPGRPPSLPGTRPSPPGVRPARPGTRPSWPAVARQLGLLACYLAARRVTSINPERLLRDGG